MTTLHKWKQFDKLRLKGQEGTAFQHNIITYKIQ